MTSVSDVVSVALLLVSLIIIVGFLSNYQFIRTGFPGILFLILLGFLVGPRVFQLVNPNELTEYVPYLSDLATNLILFEAGLGMNLRKTFRETPRAITMTLVHLILCTLGVSLFLHYYLGIDLLYGALFGIMVSGNSAAALIHIMRSINVKEEVVTVVTLESTLNNVLQVVSFRALIEIITTGYLDVALVAQGVAARFCVGSVIGFLFGIFWLQILSRIKHERFESMLTIAVLFVSYYASEYLGGNGALSSLLFGIVLGNERFMDQLLGLPQDLILDDYLVRFESELAFLIRTFFFVYIGLTINITNPDWILYGTIISAILLLMRVTATYLTTIGSSLKSERGLISMALSRGLNEAVLTVIFLNYGLAYSQMFQNIAFMVIIVTNILCTIGVYRYNHSKKTLTVEESFSEHILETAQPNG
jgi:cell volume regulation protein A